VELLRKAENLTEAYELLDPNRPLEGRWLERFYTERPEEFSTADLLDGLSFDSSADDKTLFTGHRGSGKTTELARLAEKLNPTHTVVPVDAGGRLNLGDVDYADLLVVVGMRVFEEARRSGVELDEAKLDDLLFWYTTHIFEKGERGQMESEVGGELDAVFAKFSVKLTTDAPYRRETVRAEARAHLSDLLERLNALLEDLQTRSQRRTLVIVDGLEKMYDQKQVCDLFCQGANVLLAPRCRIIYTVPLALYHTNDFAQVRMAFPRNFALPNIKTVERDGSPCREGREALLEVLDCRLRPGLLSPEAAEQLVALCGGLLKELIGMARAAVLRARRLHGEQGPVQPAEVEYAARQVRNTYRAGLTEGQYRELWRLYNGGAFVNSEVAWGLIHNLSLLEYDGGEAWWAVHPIVRPLLEERRDEFSELA
jgi:energy-coupling factor transporter ATP-binding protein EcfA2